MSDPEVVYLSRDNSIDLVLLSNGSPVALSGITRVVLVLGATTLDSSVAGFGSGQAFDATVNGNYEGAAVDVLRMKLGGLAVPAGSYRGRLVTYDSDHPNGLVWTERLRVEVTA